MTCARFRFSGQQLLESFTAIRESEWLTSHKPRKPSVEGAMLEPNMRPTLDLSSFSSSVVLRFMSETRRACGPFSRARVWSRLNVCVPRSVMGGRTGQTRMSEEIRSG